MKELLKELEAIDSNLRPNTISYHYRSNDWWFMTLTYDQIEVEIRPSVEKLAFGIYSFDDDRTRRQFIYAEDYRFNFDLINTLYNNKDKIKDIVLKYI